MNFELRAPSRGLAAHVRLDSSAGRWIAVARAGGRDSTGIGPSPRAAVVASLAWLGAPAVSELLVDLRLLDVSRRLIAEMAV